jgi:hypothetical protein
MWLNFIQVLLTCMLIAEITSKFRQVTPNAVSADVLTIRFTVVTVVGLLALKKGAVAVPLMIPLIVGTILFSRYVRKQHFRVTENRKSPDAE